jgi:hypothetical protein
MDLEGVFEALETDLRLHIAEQARRRLFVHAGVVGWRGRAIVIPGRSFTGKSSLVAALVQAGANYYSDEYAVFDARGCVHPYLVPLSIRRENSEQPEKVPVETLGGLPGVKALPVGLVAVAKYQQGTRWQPRLLSPGQAVLALLANTVAARRRPEVALNWLAQVVSNARVLQGVRGEAVETAISLLSGVDG